MLRRIFRVTEFLLSPSLNTGQKSWKLQKLFRKNHALRRAVRRYDFRKVAWFCQELLLLFLRQGGVRRDVRYLTTLSVTEILILSVDGDWMVVGAHKPRSPGRTHFVCCWLIFVGPQCGNCFISHYWRPEFWRGLYISGKICEHLCGWMDQRMNEWCI
jgi:hypothetical protein